MEARCFDIIVLFLVAAVLEIAVVSFSFFRKLFPFFAEGYCPVCALLLAVYTDPSDVSGSGSDSGQFLFNRARNLHTFNSSTGSKGHLKYLHYRFVLSGRSIGDRCYFSI